jgi:nitrate reductase alpha subunit
MKHMLFAGALCVGLAASGSAFADRWVTPVNGTVSAVAMSGGQVMMKIQLPKKEFQMIDRNMKANDRACIIQETYYAAADTMILVCGKAGATAG